MHISTLDPISMQHVSDLGNAPFVIEGSGQSSLKVIFENEANRDMYLRIPSSDADEVAQSC